MLLLSLIPITKDSLVWLLRQRLRWFYRLLLRGSALVECESCNLLIYLAVFAGDVASMTNTIVVRLPAIEYLCRQLQKLRLIDAMSSFKQREIKWTPSNPYIDAINTLNQFENEAKLIVTTSIDKQARKKRPEKPIV